MTHPVHSTERTRGERYAEAVTGLFGSWRFIIWQTAFVTCWIVFNVVAVALRWDPYPFILLNLAFSTQAAYAAPLILLSQNRQADIDRRRADHDHEQLTRNTAMTSDVHAVICKDGTVS